MKKKSGHFWILAVFPLLSIQSRSSDKLTNTSSHHQAKKAKKKQRELRKEISSQHNQRNSENLIGDFWGKMLRRFITSSLILQGRMFLGPATTCHALVVTQQQFQHQRDVCTTVQRYPFLNLITGSGSAPLLATRLLHTGKGPLYNSNTGPSSTQQQQTDWKKLTNEEWAERLAPEAYFCTREGGTEPPFSGQYVNHKAEGVYKCVCCGSDLFSSKAKYDSKSGWPSFHSSIDDGSVTRRKDVSHGMVRNEILCATCNAHLGHVFDDGPQPTGERFCVNSVSLKFTPKKLS